MRPRTIARALTVALLVAGTSILAAPEQTGTPGQMTQARDAIYERMWRVLSQPSADHRAVVEILRDTKPDLPAYFQ